MMDLIDRQAALDAMDTWDKFGCDPDGKLVRYDKDKHYTPYVRYEDMVHVIKHLPPAQQWIPCNKEMPKEDHQVGLHYPHSELVLMSIFKAIDNISLVDFGHTINGRWWSDTCDCRIRNGWEVLAWMPLPQPYKGGQGE